MTDRDQILKEYRDCLQTAYRNGLARRMDKLGFGAVVVVNEDFSVKRIRLHGSTAFNNEQAEKLISLLEQISLD